MEGNAEPTTAPMPIKNVCIAKPDVRWLSGQLSATNALNGSMDILNEASIIITIPAPIHNTGNTEVSKPELGNTTNAMEDKIAPTKK
jgi:hypothetical protein